MPPVKMRGDGRKARNPKKTISRLLSYLAEYRSTMVVVVICIIFSAIAQAARFSRTSVRRGVSACLRIRLLC